MAADLHCHTKLSDGSVGIEDLIVIAQKSGIDTIAITDHDCLAGTVRGKVIGKRYGVNVIPGVEISAIDNEAGKKVHILCYLADAPDRLEGLCKRTSIARKRAGQIMMLKVAGRFPITSDFIISHASGSTNLYKQHIMHALMDAGYTNEIFGDLFHALFSRESETNVLAPTKYPSIEECWRKCTAQAVLPYWRIRRSMTTLTKLRNTLTWDWTALRCGTPLQRRTMCTG